MLYTKSIDNSLQFQILLFIIIFELNVVMLSVVFTIISSVRILTIKSCILSSASPNAFFIQYNIRGVDDTTVKSNPIAKSPSNVVPLELLLNLMLYTDIHTEAKTLRCETQTFCPSAKINRAPKFFGWDVLLRAG